MSLLKNPFNFSIPTSGQRDGEKATEDHGPCTYTSGFHVLVRVQLMRATSNEMSLRFDLPWRGQS